MRRSGYALHSGSPWHRGRAYDTPRLLRTVICLTLKVETREELAVGAKPEQLVGLLRTLPVGCDGGVCQA